MITKTEHYVSAVSVPHPWPPIQWPRVAVSLYGMLEQNIPITNCKTFTEPNSPRAERNQWRSPHWSDTQDFNSKWNLFSELFNLVAVNFYIFACKFPDWYWLEELRTSQISHKDFLSSVSWELWYINGARESPERPWTINHPVEFAKDDDQTTK